ncbi:aldehyde dehydrogenase [Gulosibacter sp. 10]|uniref:aldehyde dehydrogenase family protein n=1 Tax=Gulosibacter sp. 10 TaxID=1255570 RepID=UPI00097EC41B|nr:aldehyde dehydrogenase family protein [Gulosibacter sp. 10]SJM70949.1 Aldehyde dehydrogenase [Gulosibacter sp. 10]
MSISAASENTIRSYGLIIAGEEEPGAETSTRSDPATGREVARFARASREDVERAIAEARRVFDEGDWPRWTGPRRSAALLRLADLMARDAERLARIETEEVGKPIRLARGDVAGSIAMARYAAAVAQTETGEVVDNVDADVVSMVVREPAGVIGMITPWNFPLLQLMQKLPYALAAGCTAVVKPAEVTAGTTVEVARLCKEAGIPAGVVNIVTGRGSVVGTALAESPDVDVLSFTGSTEVGAEITRASASTTKRLSMELGGKAAAIVLPDADLEQAATGIITGAMYNSGECCVATTRLLVHESVADELLAVLVEAFARVRVGDPKDESTDVGAMIHAGHLETVLGYVEDARARGLDIVFGGEALAEGPLADGYFVRPALIDGVDRRDPIFQEEIFGPVLAVTRFSTAEEAISLANDVDYGLANTVWSAGMQTALPVARAIRSGTVWVNTTLENAPQMPTGGLKRSGYGREMGRAGYEEFTEPKTITVRLAPAAPVFGVEQ